MSVAAFFLSAFAAIVSPTPPDQEARIREALAPAVARMAPNNPCKLPSPDPTDFFAVIGASGGKSVATVAIGDESDVTEVAEVHIAKGEYPVFLALNSPEAILWRITGDTDRIRKVIVVHASTVGVVGVDRSRILLAEGGNCGLGFALFRGRSLANEVQVLATFGRRANAIGGNLSLQRAIVSDLGIEADPGQASFSGTRIINLGEDPVLPRPATHGQKGSLQLTFDKYYPGGLVETDPADVIATGKVTRYTAVPGLPGAIKLEQEGAIKAATAADIAHWKSRAILDGRVRADQIDEIDFSAAYRVTRPITLPGSLCGAFSLTLFTPSREFVKGDSCHSGIFVDDGTIMAGGYPAESK